MKNIILILLLITGVNLLKAQDLIIKKNGEEIKAKVLSIEIDQIKYKRFDFQDGPVMVIAANDVVLVKYENGVNKVIGPIEKSPSNISKEINVTPIVDEVKTEKLTKIEYVNGSFSRNDRTISYGGVSVILRETKDVEIISLVKKSRKMESAGNVMGRAIGTPLIFGGVMFGGLNLIMNDGEGSSIKGVMIASAVLITGGITLKVIRLVYKARQKKLIRKAVNLYNSKYVEK